MMSTRATQVSSGKHETNRLAQYGGRIYTTLHTICVRFDMRCFFFFVNWRIPVETINAIEIYFQPNGMHLIRSIDLQSLNSPTKQ